MASKSLRLAQAQIPAKRSSRPGKARAFSFRLSVGAQATLGPRTLEHSSQFCNLRKAPKTPSGQWRGRCRGCRKDPPQTPPHLRLRRVASFLACPQPPQPPCLLPLGIETEKEFLGRKGLSLLLHACPAVPTVTNGQRRRNNLEAWLGPGGGEACPLSPEGRGPLCWKWSWSPVYEQ